MRINAEVVPYRELKPLDYVLVHYPDRTDPEWMMVISGPTPCDRSLLGFRVMSTCDEGRFETFFVRPNLVAVAQTAEYRDCQNANHDNTTASGSRENAMASKRGGWYPVVP